MTDSTKKKFSWSRRIRSFQYALAGLRHLIRQEPHARIHIIAALAAIICGWYLDIGKSEWLAIILCIGLVLVTETINTAIENICDFQSPAYHPKIKIIKDLAAAAVLVSAIVALVIAGYIFIPRLLALLNMM